MNGLFKATAVIVSCLMVSFAGYSQTEPYEYLLDHRSGFAKDVRGGAGGTLITITETGDAGFIQLRNAVHGKDNLQGKKQIR